MTIDVGTNMEKVSMTEMVRKDFIKLVPMVRKHPLAMRNYVMMM